MPETSPRRIVGGRLAYYRWGNRPGPAVMLLHSLGQDSTTWSDVAPALAQRHTVYALDLRGHGASSHMPRYSLDAMSNDILEALDELDLVDTCIVGHSLGGMVAYLAAGQRPASVGRLILEEAPPPLPAKPPRLAPDKPGTDLGFDWLAVPAIYRERNQPDPRWWDLLAHISIPTLLLAGGATSHVDQRQLAALAGQLPDCRMLTIEAGHEIHSTEPEAFVAAIEAFLDP